MSAETSGNGAPAAAERYVLKLYVTGATLTSRQAIERVRELCEQRLAGRYELEVIDVRQLPALARGDQIVATPTLIKVLPEPIRRYIGNLARVEGVLFGLDLRERT
ncbi:MAG TPA: circadian clock KaiB family protein [Anaeromyxobacteraceae bacterium]|nr:circadian clock KaiB family protein [Anaeromyxobacteraceae bacterium]